MSTPHPHTDERLMQLEIKISYAEDMIDTLNALVVKQQDQIDLLLREVARMRQQDPGSAPTGPVAPRDELPPHY